MMIMKHRYIRLICKSLLHSFARKYICDDNRSRSIRTNAISKYLSMTKLIMFNHKIIRIDDNSMTTCLSSITKSLESDDYIIHFRS